MYLQFISSRIGDLNNIQTSGWNSVQPVTTHVGPQKEPRETDCQATHKPVQVDRVGTHNVNIYRVFVLIGPPNLEKCKRVDTLGTHNVNKYRVFVLIGPP